MRSVLLAAMLCAAAAPAAAQGEVPQPAGTLVVEPPQELQSYDEAAAKRRLAEIDRALVHLRTPIGRANARLARATLRAAQARRERLAWLVAEIAWDEAKVRARSKPERGRGAIRRAEAAKLALAHERESARLRVAAARANEAAIAELTDLVCDPAERGRGPGCRTPPALQAWPDLDEALYRLAFALALDKRPDDAARVYRRIVDETPRSRHHTAALVAAAERAFERSELAAAEPLYRAAQAAQDPAAAELRAYATYKLGWVHLAQNRGPDAFACFAAVPALAGADPRGELLVREARKDLARAFASYGAPADAFDALEAAAPGHGLELLARLGDLWLEMMRSADANAVHRELRRRAPADPRGCDWQIAIARAAKLGGTPEELVSELEALATAVDATRGQPAARSCAREAHDLLYEVARRQFREARRALRTRPKEIEYGERAERTFTALLRAFPGDPDVGEIRLQRAEATVLLAEVATAAQAAALWRRAAIRFSAAIQSRGLDGSRRRQAIEGLARARTRAAAP
jgi:hypothetical protein